MSGNDKQLPPLMSGSFEYDHYIAADYNDYDDYRKVQEDWEIWQADNLNTSQSSVEMESVNYITGYERDLRGRNPRSPWKGWADIWCRRMRRTHGQSKRTTLRSHRPRPNKAQAHAIWQQKFYEGLV